MKNLKQIEQLMMQSSRNANADYRNAFEGVLTVYRFKDKKHHTNHCRIINMLYNAKTRKFTYLGIATMLNISDNALRRYRNEYAELFCYFLDLEQHKKSIG